MKKIIAALAATFAIVCTAFAVTLSEGKTVAHASLANVYGGLIRYDDEDFSAFVNSSAPEIEDYFQMKKAGRKVKLDEGKSGVLISSKGSGSAVNGKSFMLGGIMSGKFSIDFRLFSHLSFQTPNDESTGWWSSGNDYADVQRLAFTFRDIESRQMFTVNFSAATKYSASIPTMSVTLPDGTTRAHAYGDQPFDQPETDLGVQVDADYYTRLDGTGFSNTASRVNTYVYTYGANSTAFYFDPSDMRITADRYTRDGSIGEGKYSSLIKYQNQSFDGRNTVLRKDNLLVLDLDDANETGGNVITGFEKYTVEVCFEKMTDNSTVVKNDGVDVAYDRFARMYIYNLCGKALTGTDGGKDTEAPFVYGQLANGFIGKEYIFHPLVYDNRDGIIPFNGKIQLICPDGREETLDSSAFVPEQKGKYRVIFTGVKDKAGNEAEPFVTEFSVNCFEFDQEMDTYVLLNEKIKIPQARIVAGGAELTAEIGCKAPDGKEVALANGEFIADRTGVYTITYTCEYSDILIEEERQIVCINGTDGSLIYDKEDFATAENFSARCFSYASQELVVLDEGKKGLLIESRKTGVDAKNCGFGFRNVFWGNFAMDFRVFSGETFSGAFDKNSAEERYSDKVNPYLDLKEVTFTFRDLSTDKKFSLIVCGSDLAHNSTPAARVITGRMKAPTGLTYVENAGVLTVAEQSVDGTLLTGTSFSNVAEIGGEALTGYPTSVFFDAAAMKVYASVYTKAYAGGRWNGEYREQNVVIAELSNPAHVGMENVLPPFGGYSVDIEFTDVTDNGENAAGPAYDRYARMIVYAVDGQSFALGDGKLANTAGAQIFCKASDLRAGQEGKVLISTYDFLDGERPYEGKVRYSYFGETAETQAVCVKGELKITAERAGKLLLRVEPASDLGGITGKESTFIVNVYKEALLRWNPKIKDAYDLNDGAVLVSVDDVEIADPDETAIVSYVRLSGAGEELTCTKVGEYVAEYYVKCFSGRTATLTRTFRVEDKTAPVLSMESATVDVAVGSKIDVVMPAAHDKVDGSCDVSVELYLDGEKIKSEEELFENGLIFTVEKTGEYKLVYAASDASGNLVCVEMRYRAAEKKADGCCGALPTGGASFVALVVCAGWRVYVLYRRKR